MSSELPDILHDLCREAWTNGPLGERARALVRSRLTTVAGWTRSYRDMARTIDPRTFVVTHGEPGLHNQWVAEDGRWLLLDWESLLLAPAERDLGPVGLVHNDVTAMFALEWRLSEIAAYADCFSSPHTGTEDDRVALADLAEQLGLEQAPWA